MISAVGILLDRRNEYLTAGNPLPVAVRVSPDLADALPANFCTRMFGMDIVIAKELRGGDVEFIEKWQYLKCEESTPCGI